MHGELWVTVVSRDYATKRVVTQEPKQLWRDRAGVVPLPGRGRFSKNRVVGVTTFNTAWDRIRRKAGVSGRWHDNRHTLITELAESGAGDETIMEIAGHVSRQMLSRYSHIRMEAKRKALAEVDRQRAADKAQREKAQPHAAAVNNVAQPLPVQ